MAYCTPAVAQSAAPSSGYVQPAQVPYPDYAPQPQPVPYAETPAEGVSGGKRKATAVLLAFFFGPFAWLYTYKKDSTRFWAAVAIGLVWNVFDIAMRFDQGIITIGYIAAPAVWLWAFITSIARSSEWYSHY